VHLILDLETKEANVLQDEARACRFLREAVEVLGLEVVCNPLVYKFPNPGGITLLACLKESSIVLHTYPEHRMLYVDVFACRPFHAGTVYKLLDSIFGIADERRALLLTRSDFST